MCNLDHYILFSLPTTAEAHAPDLSFSSYSHQNLPAFFHLVQMGWLNWQIKAVALTIKNSTDV